MQLIDRFENESLVKPYWLYPALEQLKNLSLLDEHEHGIVQATLQPADKKGDGVLQPARRTAE